MQEFKKGQRVRVEYEATVCRVYPEGFIYLQSDEAGMPIRVADPAKVTITLLDPSNWPPQMGDIWEIEGDEYFARQSLRREIVMIPDSGQDPWELDRFKALNPVLVRRRGQ